MSTLAEFMILSGGDNHPPMLEKHLYDSWKSRMELYMQNREHGRMILESVKHGPLIWPTIEVNGVTRTKKYEELSATEKIQADCDLKATSIILQGLPSDVYSLDNHHRVAKDLWERVQLLMQDSGLAVPVFKQGDDPIDAINKMMSFLSKGRQSLFAAGTSGTRANISGTGGNNSAQGYSKVLNEEELGFLADLGVVEGPAIQKIITHNTAYQADDFDAYDSDCDDFSTAKAVLMANLSSYGSDVLSKEKETKNIDKEIALEKKVKEMDNIVCKMGQSAQTVHMLTKPQVFYDNNLKQVLGFQNPFYLKKSQQIRPMLYDGSVIAKETNVISIADSKEILMLEEESRSKMLLKQNFSKRFVPQQELSNEQAFWLQTLHHNTDQSASLPVKIKAPRELPKGEVVYTTSLRMVCEVFCKHEKKELISSHDTPEWNIHKPDVQPPDPCSKGESILTHIVPQQELSDEQAFWLQTSHHNTDQSASLPVKIEAPRELPKKQFLMENDRILDQIISQDIVNIVVNSSLDINTSVNVNSSVSMNDSVNYVKMCNKCLELEAELIKQHNMVEKDEYNRLLKSFSKLEQHCISLELAMQLNKENFQKNNTSMNQTEPSFD
ncbi:hypothetical protein Tco_0819195 [Tanacetum coccineum]|uniref:Uncharacterized protein n=1 Tax=Tanacetum coccineum TaxID=301880 RepID=A0ABQ5A5U7_9ASTR